jgi:hypothetical protein
MSSLARSVLAALLIASFGMTSAQPARADQAAFSRNIIIGAALAAVGIIIGSNVAHKAQLASTVVGYTQDGATVYADGRVVYGNGYSFYPGDHGQQIACRNMSCTIYAGNSASYNSYYQWNGTTWGPPASQPQQQPQPQPQYYAAPQPQQYYPPAQPQPQYYSAPQPQPQYYSAPQQQYYPQPQGYYQHRAYGYPAYGYGTANAYAQAYDAYYRAYETYYKAYYDYYNRAHPGREQYVRYDAPQPYCCDPASNPYAGYAPGYPQPGY